MQRICNGSTGFEVFSESQHRKGLVCFECFSPLLPQTDVFLGLFILWGPLQIHCEILDSPCNIASQCPSQPTSLVRYPIIREQLH